MANNYVNTGNRVTIGSEVGAGIAIADKVPYEDSDYGGLCILNGPVQIGVTKLPNPPLGTLYVSDTVPTSGPVSLAAIYIDHLTKGIKLDSDDIGVEIDAAKTNTIKAGTLNQYTAPDNTFVGDVNVTSGDFKNSNLKSCSGQSCSWSGSSINVQGWKGFDIKHPNKKGHRLRHVCIEGPEAGVYIRGRLNKGNKIELPDYWKGLVDTESITVSLTAIGVGNQDLFVEKIEWGKTVIVKSGTGSNIDCYYVINASRIDGEPLIVEYEGDTPAQYPGNSEQFSISGYDYGRGVDKT
tara:strand:+ start:304 stop:1188 length:885 start_codon:yes stop_codon:yes gene_type:complete